MFFTNKKRIRCQIVESKVHWYFFVPVACILIKRAQKHHNLIEKPLKMADFVQYLLGRLYTKICQGKLKKSASSYHTQTGGQACS